MTKSAKPSPLALATLSVLAVAGVGLWGWSLDPARPARWALAILLIPLIWGYLEIAQFRGEDREVGAQIMNFHRLSIAWGGLMIAVGSGLKLAVANDVLGLEWIPIRSRLIGIMLGAGLAMFGNYVPKLLSPWRLADEPFEWQPVHRFAGWVLSLGGVAVALVWLTLPLEQAKVASTRLVLTVLALAVGRKLISLVTHSPARSTMH